MDGPAVFPPEILPFARAHTAGLDRLRSHTAKEDTVGWVMLTPGGVDWVMLTPGRGLEQGAPSIGRYVFSGPYVFSGEQAAEGARPTRHRTRVSVTGVE